MNGITGDRRQDLRAKLREVDASIDQVKAHLKQLKAERRELSTAIAQEGAEMKKEAVRTQEAFRLNVMARVDQRMTTKQIADALRCNTARVTHEIAAHRRAQGVPKKARRRRPLPERRTTT